MAQKKKKGSPLIFGLILLGGSILALWKNEHRFDYHKAAVATEPVNLINDLSPDQLFSHTGKMDQSLTLNGRYVESFQGFLEVKRSAEIYAWDRDEDDDGVTWTKEWMSSLEKNDRNNGLNQRLASATIRPEAYQISDLTIDPEEIQFVDRREEILPSALQLTTEGTHEKLVMEEEFFYLAKARIRSSDSDEKLGDERLSYLGLPVPATATYFGKWGEGRAIFHQAEKKEGLISSIIGDKGILHHLVAGERETALASIKIHLARVKNITRLVGLVVASIGGGVFFSSMTRFLVFIPVVGPLVNRISGWLGMLIGFILGLITLILAFLTSKPLILALFILVLLTSLYLLSKNARQRRKRVQEDVAKTLGYSPSQSELEELEFIKLWQLLAGDNAITAPEQKQLNRWIKRHRWSSKRVAEVTQRAQNDLANTNSQDKLESLIRFTLADGRIDRTEMKSLEQAARKVGVSKSHLSLLITQMQRV